MKKLSLYIFLVLMWCNVGFAALKCTQIKTPGFGGSGKQKLHIYIVAPSAVSVWLVRLF